jgi:hypothetical protein
MKHVFLGLIFLIGAQSFAMEEDREPKYRPLSPDAVDKVYDKKNEVHRRSVVQRAALPTALKDVEGPLPFVQAPGYPILGRLLTEYFASLQFDHPEIREETEKLRKAAKEADSHESLKLLYRAGWQMGDPEAIKELSERLKSLRKTDRNILPKGSNLLFVLGTYPDTLQRVLQSIRMARVAIEYGKKVNKSRSSSDETEEPFELTVSDDGGEGEASALLGSGILRHRYPHKASGVE